MRALACCLPDHFELDTDGRKAAWKARFMSRVKELVARQNGDTKGGWDAVKQKECPCPASLSAVESRRDVYFYRSHNDMLAEKENMLVRLIKSRIIDDSSQQWNRSWLIIRRSTK